MPNYTVTECRAALTPALKAALAAEITNAHQAITGANRFFAEVIFRSVDPGDFFIGGQPLEDASVFVLGHIRAGRTDDQKARLIEALIEGVGRVTHLPRTAVWVYITELPASHMAEFGQVLPPAGDEERWLRDLPDKTRQYLDNIGNK